MNKIKSKGFICIFTVDRTDELRRFLKSFLHFNHLPLHVVFAKDIKQAHEVKTQIVQYSPFDLTCFLDTDMLVNADLSSIFEVAESGKIGVVRERGVSVLNTGMIVFPKYPMNILCREWYKLYVLKIESGFTGEKGVWDQDIFNKIIKKYAHQELGCVWNWVIKDVSPEEEKKYYDDIKIFHFMHSPEVDRNKYKSYQTWISL